jgi:multisubunit Na+/H+ antiporter MnhE subunit
MPEETGPLAGEPRERALDLPWARRAGSWFIWWILMMSFWVMLDDSIATDELLAGAGAAALAALLAELVTYQAATRFRMRIRWIGPALRLPGEVARDLVIIYVALWRRLVHGEQPDSVFTELPSRYGDDSPEGVTRRTLLIGGRSLAPNLFVLGIDPDRDMMVVHQLVTGPRAGHQDNQQGKGV